jgi:hypothetical protein
VLSIGETTPRELSRAVEELRAMGVPPAGAVHHWQTDDGVKKRGVEPCEEHPIRPQ